MTEGDKKYLCINPGVQYIRFAKCIYTRQMEIFSNVINFCEMRTSCVSSSFRKYANFEWSVLTARYR